MSMVILNSSNVISKTIFKIRKINTSFTQNIFKNFLPSLDKLLFHGLSCSLATFSVSFLTVARTLK